MTTNLHRPLGLLTVADCAELLQCGITTVEEWIRSGELRRVALSTREVGPGSRGPKGWRVTPTALEEFIQSREGRERQKEEEPITPTKGKSAPSLPLATGRDGKSRLKLTKSR